MVNKFDNSINDSQATAVEPIQSQNFDYEAYKDYEASLLEQCKHFWLQKYGAIVYRRMRVGEVFSHGSRDMQNSLELQLGALQKSMAFKADIPNFLEPWYGIGTIAAAYGSSYLWTEGQAPAVVPLFKSVKEALDFDPIPVKETGIGKHTLEMIEYFLEKTKGKLPISLADTQSPLNAACNIVDISSFMTDTILNPDGIKEFLDIIADLLIDFTLEQLKLIGDNIVWPGHGFASSRNFTGIGMSDDNMLMLSGSSYVDLVKPAIEKFGNSFGGPVFHSCGNFADRLEYIKKIKNLKMVDGAFSNATDPDPNPPHHFVSLKNTGVVLNARMVGDVHTVTEIVEKLWQSDMKLIAVTFCQTAREQEIIYNRIHDICV